MNVFHSMDAWQRWRTGIRKPVGFVPTMGALHDGHLSLVRRSLLENAVTVASIYVNPTQFDQAGDLNAYPRTESQDLELLEKAGVDAVIMPDYNQLYPDNYRYRISENELSLKFCGAHRPGHFDGVLSVVMKLFNLVKPLRAYFGEKDFQQLELIRGMVQAFFMDVEIIGCDIVREQDGLAMSSRNQRLDKSQRARAPALFRSLVESDSPEAARRTLKANGFAVDYVEDHRGRRLAAASLGDVRLIDNVALPSINPMAAP